MRTEEAVFADLSALCRSPGYVHAIAQICCRDNLVRFRGHVRPEDLQPLYGHERLIRTEITTLIGLMVQASIDFTSPEAEVLRGYVERTDTLMAELHRMMGSEGFTRVLTGNGKPDSDALRRGAVLREPIFYGGESAYIFQYRDLALQKYAGDDAWLRQNKGFGIATAHAVAKAMSVVQDGKCQALLGGVSPEQMTSLDLLPLYELSADEIAAASGVAAAEVQAIFDAFTFTGNNSDFKTVSDFNAAAAFPLLGLPDGKVLLLQQYSIAEAFYETPFYWMVGDLAYQPTAAKNRGEFTEAFSVERLVRVFGTDRVHRGVHLLRQKGKEAGEIDVLVVFGDRLVVVQIKSKRLTLEARKGNDGQLRGDFQKAIQDSYDQALLCSELLIAGSCQLLDAQGRELQLPAQPKEVFIFNVVADHYPALAFQARQFLQAKVTEQIRAPFVMDVFLLDAMTEMLESPLRLLSYASLRAQHADRLAINHELTALGYHLAQNLWLGEQADFAMLHDDVASGLDAAMIVRREGLPGARTPDGILTRFAGTMFEDLVRQVERSTESATIDLGFLLLTLGEDTCRLIDERIGVITRTCRADGQPHDFTIAIGGTKEGITFHCNPQLITGAPEKLQAYCYARKYVQKAERWYGVSMDGHGRLQFGVKLEFPWEHSAEMDAKTAGMKRGSAIAPPVQGPAASRTKVGRNDPCPCGSGKKFKKCCLPR